MRCTNYARPSDVASDQSSQDPAELGSRWWVFTLPRPRDSDMGSLHSDSHVIKAEKRGFRFKDRSVSWRPSTRGEKDPDTTPRPEKRTDWGLRMSLPLPIGPVHQPFTLAHNRTPGWETPWTPRAENGSVGRDLSYMDGDMPPQANLSDSDNLKNISKWQERKKKLRAFILTNPHAPLVSSVRVFIQLLF